LAELNHPPLLIWNFAVALTGLQGTYLPAQRQTHVLGIAGTAATAGGGDARYKLSTQQSKIP